MFFDLISDTHEDVGRGGNPLILDMPQPECKTLVVAGDLAEYQSLRSNKFRFLRDAKLAYENVIYIAGNHEFYGGNYQNVLAYLRKECSLIGVIFLQDESVEIEGVSFYGTTLFTDFNGGSAESMKVCKASMADFTYISYTKTDETGKSVTKCIEPKDYMDIHNMAIYNIEKHARTNPDKKIVLVTHHAMSYDSVHPKYLMDRHLNGGFASNRRYVLEENPNIAVHVHGHMHDSARYDINKTRVYSNPRGYKHEANVYYRALQIKV